MSRLIAFYRGEGTDVRGRTLDMILAWGDGAWEAVHDFIQWLFPLPEPSAYNPAAPLLTADDVAAFRADEGLRVQLRRSFVRLLGFLGLAEGEGGRVVDGPNLASRVPDVWEGPNHNWLRITRVLRSLSLLGLEAEARALYQWLREARDSGRFPVGADTFRFWTQAIEKGATC